MIAAVRHAEGLSPRVVDAVGAALGDGRRGRPAFLAIHDFTVWNRSSDRHPDGRTLLFGRIDNRADIARALHVSGATPDARLYAAAYAEWGDRADAKLVGHYCAITVEGPGRLRLVRSPWTAPPLHFVAQDALTAASPLLSALFAAGAQKRIDWSYLADQLAYDHRDCEPVGWFAGIGRVPLGSRVHIDGPSWRLDRYYDPTAVSPIEMPRDEDYVERAKELLDEAARAALAGVDRPAIMLSGGLDSPLAAAAVMKQLPRENRLQGYTFGPHPDWDGWVPQNRFGDERERVQRFAAMHPRLETHFPEALGGHDHGLREVLARSEVPTANIANTGVFHPLFDAARAQGCDAMLTALHGNFTISLDASWAIPEALRQRRFASLFAMLDDEDSHGRIRQMLSKAVLPLLPSRLQRRVRSLAHPGRFAEIPLASLLSCKAGEPWRERARLRGSTSVFDRPPIPGSRVQAIQAMWASADGGEDLDLGLERLYGMAHRDVTAYRPLIEFCHGLPTDQLRRGRTDRYLARRMAKGLLPEEQRLEVKQGRHNVDWHARLSARREDLLAQAEALRAHPPLSRLLDIDRMQQLLRDWPQSTPDDPVDRLPREMGLTRAFTAATFVSHVEKRNDF